VLGEDFSDGHGLSLTTTAHESEDSLGLVVQPQSFDAFRHLACEDLQVEGSFC
jgi:hypothetical protein